MALQNTSIDVSFDDRVFSVTAIKKAAYVSLHMFTIEVTVQDHQICCQLRFGPAVDEATQLRAVNEFRKEVLDQDLRERLQVETEPIRNVILAHAFSKAGLSAHESVSRD